MSTITKHYRVDGRDNYTMQFQQRSDGTFKIYAVSCPTDPYGNGPHVHHRYSDGEICVAAGHEPTSVDRSVAIASVWMKRYSDYVRSGQFNNSGGRVNV